MAEPHFEEVTVKTEIKSEDVYNEEANQSQIPKIIDKIKTEPDLEANESENLAEKSKNLGLEDTAKVYENGKKNRLACPICNDEKTFKNRASLKQHLKFVHPSEEDEVTCDECFRTFKSISSLRSHVSSVHVTQEEIVCHNCDKIFSNKKRLLNHIYYSHPKPSEKVSCKICSKEFKKNYSLKIHMRTVHPSVEKSVSCPYCEKVFKVDMLLKRHIKWSHPEDGLMYKCTECNRMLPSMACYNKHWMNVHCKSQEVSCELCSQVFKTPKSLQRHLTTVHGDKKQSPKKLNVGTIPCTECSRKFATNTALLWHVEKCHNQKPNVCRICSIEINDPSLMDEHMAVEHNTEKIECDICKKQFKWYNTLKRHIDTAHNAEKSLCTICNKMFKSTLRLQRHMDVTHAPPSAAVDCEICQKTFKCVMHLRIHENAVHSNAGTFACEICKKEFSSKKYLVKHSKCHLTSSKIPCDLCGKFYKNNNEIRKHKKRIHLKKTLENTNCSTGNEHSNTSSHNDVPQSHDCVKCGTSFPSTLEMQSHAVTCDSEIIVIEPYNIEVKVEMTEED